MAVTQWDHMYIKGVRGHKVKAASGRHDGYLSGRSECLAAIEKGYGKRFLRGLKSDLHG